MLIESRAITFERHTKRLLVVREEKAKKFQALIGNINLCIATWIADMLLMCDRWSRGRRRW